MDKADANVVKREKQTPPLLWDFGARKQRWQV